MRHITLLLFSFLTLTWTTSAFAQVAESPNLESIILTDQQDEFLLGQYLEILEDPGGELTIDEVSSPEFDSRFTPSQVKIPNYGFTDSVYWVRIHLDNETRDTNDWLLEVDFTNMQFVDLYTPQPDDQGFVVKQTGNARPLSTRDVLHPQIVFDLIVPTQSQQTAYLRFQNGASMTLGLTLWTVEAFSARAQLELALNSLFFGAVLALLVYYVFLVIVLREAIYLFFVFLLASLFATVLSYSGYLQVYLFPDLYLLKPLILPLAFALLIGSILLFSLAFLESRTRYPKLHRVEIVLLVGWGMLLILTPFVSYHQIALLMTSWALISLVTTLGATIVVWRRGFHPARFLLLAWFGALAGLLLVVLVRRGSIPSTKFTEQAYLLGLLWMAVCWSIALADRINLLKARTEDINRDLRTSERRLSQILEGLPLGVVVYGKDSKPKFANRRVMEILSNPTQGIWPDLSAGRTLVQAMAHFSFRVTGSDQEYPLENMPVYRALQGEPASVDDLEADLVDRRVPLEIWASPVRDETGNVESAVVAFQDITLRKRADAELAEYHQHLEMLVEQRTLALSATNEQLNSEIDEREKLQQLLYQRIEWLTVLYQIRQTIGGSVDLSDAYDQLTATILRLLEARVVCLILWDQKGEPAGQICHSQQEDSVADIERIKAAFQRDSQLRQDLERREVITLSVAQTAALYPPLGQGLEEDSVQSLIFVPVYPHKSVSGVLVVAYDRPVQDLNLAQTELIEAMTRDLVELGNDAHLLDQAHAFVAAEERNRLARDLHDSVTQVLFSASLVAEVLPQIWRRDPEKTLQSLEELRRLTRGALAEMRTMLLELRPASVLKTPLPELLAQLAEAITGRIDLPFQLFLEQVPSLPEEVHISFYRIAQEALNNVVKHSQATHVTLGLSAAPFTSVLAGEAGYEVKMVIADDGVGFSSEVKGHEHLGIGIMRERADNIAALLSIDSQLAHGTQVTLIWHRETKDLL